MKAIARQQFPALNQILWDTSAQFIEPKNALHCYEKRWRFINKDELTIKEQQLIQQLIKEVGNGLFLPA